MSSNRQLAVIMFTDIVGYTGLMGRDERQAFELLEKNRQMQRPIIEAFNGKWIKELGDGVMASFHTVTDAVNAAIRIQQQCHAEKSFQLRIGIHLGEVIFENDDVFGDGVNIASRIQAMAHPGSIFISESVYNNIANKKEFQTKFFADQRLKNVSHPVKIYQVLAPDVSVAHRQLAQKLKTKRTVAWLAVLAVVILLGAFLYRSNFKRVKTEEPVAAASTETKSIAVLPFVNMSADSSQEYFSDGMTESLISDLAQTPGLMVIARNSVFQFKGKAIDPVEVGKQLNVRYILEGSLQRAGDMLRINAQLIDTRNGFHVWADKFDKKIKDLFTVQDEISRHIIDSLHLVISIASGPHSKSPTANLEAYDLYLRGHYMIRRNAANGRTYMDSAIALFEKAIELDPKFALAYAALGKAYTSIYFIFDPNEKWESKAFVAIEKALSLDPNLSHAYLAKANLTWTLSNGFPHEKAIKELKHAIKLEPNLVEAHEALGSIYFHIGLLDEALHELRFALTLDPASNFSRPRVGRVYWYQGKLDSALQQLSTLKPSGWLREQAIVLWSLGRKDEAQRALQQLESIAEDNSQKADLAAGWAVINAGLGKRKEAEENIRVALQNGDGVSHFHHAEHLIATAYALMGDATNAVKWLQTAADHGLPCYPFFKNDLNLKSLQHDPGYLSLMSKMRKQWEKHKGLAGKR